MKSIPIENLLKEIKERLDILILLNIPPFDQKKYNLKEGTQLSVLKLCNMMYTQSEMVNKLKKTDKAISRAIEKLKNKGLINPVRIGNKIVYVRS